MLVPFIHTSFLSLVQLVPMWVAPNLLTFSGWCLLIVNLALLSFYDWDFYTTSNDLGIVRPPIPAWVWLVCAIFHFLSHTLDGIDGKQARRTGMSTPLGLTCLLLPSFFSSPSSHFPSLSSFHSLSLPPSHPSIAVVLISPPFLSLSLLFPSSSSLLSPLSSLYLPLSPSLTGELFDHGLDSWATILLPLSLFSALGRGHQWGGSPQEAFLPTLAILGGFYLSHWEKYITGILYLPWIYDVLQLV